MISKEEVKRCTAFINEHLFTRYELRPELKAGKPTSHNCYTFAKMTQQVLFSRELPSITLEADDIQEFTHKLALAKIIAGDSWIQIDKPVHGCIVEMSHANIPHHIGTYFALNGGGIFHCIKGVGACFDSIAYLQVGGWRRFIYDIPR